MYLIVLTYSKLEELSIAAHDVPYYSEAEAIAACDRLVAEKRQTHHYCTAVVVKVSQANEVYRVEQAE